MTVYSGSWRDAEYSVRSGYRLIKQLEKNCNAGECSMDRARNQIWKRIWKLHMPNKLKVFVRLVCTDAKREDLCPALFECREIQATWKNRLSGLSHVPSSWGVFGMVEHLIEIGKVWELKTLYFFFIAWGMWQ